MSTPKPTNPFVGPLLNDKYQMTMTYCYWKTKKHDQHAVFDLFIRKNPFGGEFTVFAGLSEALSFISDFHFEPDDIQYLRGILPSHVEEEFYTWLAQLTCEKIQVFAPPEGTIMFPLVPFLRVEGPLAVAQLLETPLLCLINYATLVATNAARHRIAANSSGRKISLIEFGPRRAQGPDGAISASRYAYLGGFDGTSNLLAGKKFGIQTYGTMAHSFVTAFQPDEQLLTSILPFKGQKDQTLDLLDEAYKNRKRLGFSSSGEGELKAFVAYGICYPDAFLVLVDTYNTLGSGVPNFLCVALALHKAGYKPLGIRLDSGDLAYLSNESRKLFEKISQEDQSIDYFKDFQIVASNDLNETTILSLNQQGHSITSFGVGTHLVTCQNQPALGGVYKLVELEGIPRLKLSEEMSKVPIPGRKHPYRLMGDQTPLLDLLILPGQPNDPPPKPGEKILCHHPFFRQKRCHVIPKEVQPLHNLVFDGKIIGTLPTIHETRTLVQEQLKIFRPDHMRLLNPTPYKVSISHTLFGFFDDLWSQNAPIPEIS